MREEIRLPLKFESEREKYVEVNDQASHGTCETRVLQTHQVSWTSIHLPIEDLLRA